MRLGFMKLAGMLLAAFTVVAATAPARAEKLVDPAALEAWADQYYGRAIAEKRSAGIVISVVQDGKLIFAKGYGHADLGRGIPIDPEKTGMQVGSISKTFLATAIGQLVDRGQIKSLDDPVNRYLKRVKLPGDRGARVTIRQLLNHRAGFEDVNFGALMKPGRSVKVPLEASEIERFMPQIVMEPGSFANYSNWSFSLLGFMIEDISGQRIDTYLRDNIWLPLGMTHTGMAYGHIPANTARAYRFETDGTPVLARADPPHPWIAPAGTIISTASDMARYMNAQILEGEDGGFPLVSKAMFRELHTERYRNTPISMGFAHAFWTTELNGSQAIEHGGGTPNFQNVMTMIPGKRFGFYVSAMSGGLAPWASYSDDEIKAGKLAVRDAMLGYELRESFIDRFLKRTADFNVEAAARAPRVDLSAYAGTYWTQKRDFTTVEALLGAFNPAAVLTVTLSDDGKGLLLNGAGPYTQVANGVFASKTAGNVWIDPYTMDMFQPAHIGFDIDAAGNVRGMVPGLVEPQMWVPASPIFNPLVMRLIAGICGLVAVTGALLFLWPQASRCRQPANYVALLAAAAVTAMPLAVMAGFERGDSLLDQVLIGEFGRLWILIGATNALLAAGIVLAILAVRAWRRAQSATTPKWALLGYRTHLSLVALAAIGGALALGFFNLLGVHIRG